MSKEKNDPRIFFEKQKKQFSDKLSQITQKIRRISFLRILVFLITVVGIYIFSGIHLYALIAIGVSGLGLFVFLVARHARLYRKKKWYKTLLELNKTELAILDHKTSGLPGGKEYADDKHPFTSDLDIFGEGSLFQLVDRSATSEGRLMLAGRFINPLKNVDELLNRQKAINELKEKPDWRQKFQASGKLAGGEKFSVQDFLNWAENGTATFNNMFYKIMLIVTPVTGFGVVYMIASGFWGFGTFLLFLILPFLLVGGKLAQINKIHQQVSRKTELLKGYEKLFRMIENESFSSPLLREMKDRISGEKKSAQKAAGNLSKITAAFDYRLNILVGFFLNIFFLWDIRQCIRLEKWKITNGRQMKIYFNILFSLDELASLAGFAFSYPDAVFPEFSEENFVLIAKDARHPLIKREISVGNDIDIRGWKSFQIITGANMAGKSTYLRMVGTLMVLAMTGAPVPAKKFTMTPVEIHTGIKTSDSLIEGESYFFAELKRLKEIITRLENGEKLFVLLDEILRGTNSIDKHKGSEGLLKQLIRLGASGMIATHDIALGELQNSFPGQIVNKCFEVDMKDDELLFDYKIRDGISQNTNATLLMKKMKITL